MINQVTSFASIIAMAFLIFIGAPFAISILVFAVVIIPMSLLFLGVALDDLGTKDFRDSCNNSSNFVNTWIVFYGAYYAFLTYLS